jgi:hypothetical protein
MEMMDKVNARLPQEQQFDPSWWYFPKTQRLHREYRRLYPEGRLFQRVRTLMAVSFVCLLTSAWCLGTILP